MVASHFKILNDKRYFSHRWADIHTDAAFANTEELKRAFVKFFNNRCEQFPCNECKQHFREYLNNNPFDRYWNLIDQDGNDIGMYMYTLDFHNAVNVRIGKMTYTFDETYPYYCGKKKHVKTKEVEKKESDKGCKTCTGNRDEGIRRFKKYPLYIPVE